MIGLRLVILAVGFVALGAMVVWAVSALRSMRSGGPAVSSPAGLPYLAIPNPLPEATRREPVVCLSHNDLDQPPVVGNGGLWMSPTDVVFHSAAGTLSMPRPLLFAESTTEVPDLSVSVDPSEPVLSIGWTTRSGIPAVAAFRTPDATGWAIALRS